MNKVNINFTHEIGQPLVVVVCTRADQKVLSPKALSAGQENTYIPVLCNHNDHSISSLLCIFGGNISPMYLGTIILLVMHVPESTMAKDS